MQIKKVFSVIHYLSLLILAISCSKEEKEEPEPVNVIIYSFSPEKGGAGDFVTITGEGFSNTISENIVQFNGTQATVGEASTTHLKVIVPENGSTGKITVARAGKKVTSSKEFHFLPKISGFTPQQAKVGTVVTISGTNLSDVSTLSFTTATTVVYVGILSKTSSEIKFRVPSVPAGITSITIQFDILGGPIEIHDNFEVVSSWSKKSTFPGQNRFTINGFVIGTKGYVGLGQGEVNPATYFKDLWEYNAETNDWIQKADFEGEARTDAIAFAANGKGYMGLGVGKTAGGDFTAYSDIWQYDPTLNSWIKKKDFEGKGRQGVTVIEIDGKVYAGLGSGKTDFWEYDPINDDWIPKANFPGSGRTYAVSFVINGKGYIGGGWNSPRECWEYDPVSDSWKSIAIHPYVGLLGQGHMTFSIYGKGYLGGDALIYQYSPELNIWIQMGSSPIYTSLIGLSINGKGYELGNNSSRTVMDVYEFLPD